VTQETEAKALLKKFHLPIVAKNEVFFNLFAAWRLFFAQENICFPDAGCHSMQEFLRQLLFLVRSFAHHEAIFWRF